MNIIDILPALKDGEDVKKDKPCLAIARFFKTLSDNQRRTSSENLPYLAVKPLR